MTSLDLNFRNSNVAITSIDYSFVLSCGGWGWEYAGWVVQVIDFMKIGKE